MYPAFLANIVLMGASALAAALTGYQYFMISVLFYILVTGVMGQCVCLFVVAIRATLLDRRERKLGYTTWARSGKTP